MRNPLIRCVALFAALGIASPGFAMVQSERLPAVLSLPTYLTAPPGDLARLFVTELLGDIEILDRTTGLAFATPFLTVPGISGEGLQGLAFHPDYDTNGFFYVYFFGSSVSNVVRFTRSAGNPDLADVGSALPILSIGDSSTGNHNGGWIGFGPDGFLYIPVGDGGPQHDTNDRGQTIVGELRGDVLRIDVDADDFPGDPNRNYAIPPDNPFVGAVGEDEIWAYGLRNPFRASFDRLTGDFYVADVGQNTREEVNFQLAGSPGGANYGWRLREGIIATPTGGVGGPQPPDGVDPIYDYTHGSGQDEGFSVTGGYVYRGPIVQLQGKYFFADYVSERIWSIEHDGAMVTEFLDWTDALAPTTGAIEQIVGFGEDGAGDLYIVDLGGEIYRVVLPPLIPAADALQRGVLALALAALGMAALTRASSRARSARASRALPGRAR